MAEAAAVIGLVASIASLVELIAKVVSRLHEFTSKSSEVPESFRSLSTRLPLLTATLQQIQSQAEDGRFLDNVTKALKVVVNDTRQQVSDIQISLSKVLPSDGASKLERALKALKSLAKEDKVHQALENIQRNNDLLVLHQTTRHVDTGDHILEELSKLNMAPPVSSISFGVCLGQAPQIAADAFIGRTNELKQLRCWLSPKSQTDRQRIVSIVGMGGMGKTQLSLAHVRDCAEDYSSVFWVNAKDESSLRQNMADLSAVIFYGSTCPATQSADDEKLKIDKVRHWLSEPANDQWLVIFDNYDSPYLPGIEHSTGYNVRSYFPHRAQGSILITTRSPRLLFAKQLALKKIEDLEQSLAIIACRSGRKVDGDASAKRLAQQLDGLPLALATAGAYLTQSADSFDDYLELYNNSWRDLSLYSHGPMDYEERTLYSTWNVSFRQVRDHDPAAAEFFKLLAYLDNQDIWYGLFNKDISDAPAWWIEVLKSRVRFNRAMSTLHDYSLLEISAGQYSLHTCEHDWTLEYLNSEFDQERYRIAIHCITANVSGESEAEFWVRNRRVLPHARRVNNNRIKAMIDWDKIEPGDLHMLGALFRQNDMNAEAEKMYRWALNGYEKAWGPDHTSTLDTINSLGALYANQGKCSEAEKMYRRALDGYEKAWGVDHISTLFIVNNLGVLFIDQGKYNEAEEMYRRTLDGYEKAWGPDHTSTLFTVNNLGKLYKNQGKHREAEKMHQRALDGYEKAWGPDHVSTLDTLNYLGALHADQGKYSKAEKMYCQALEGKEKAWGSNHTSTLDTVNNLGDLYASQREYNEAEKMYRRALDGYQKAWGPDHESTLHTINNLRLLNTTRNEHMKAEEIHPWVLDRSEGAHATDRHPQGWHMEVEKGFAGQ